MSTAPRMPCSSCGGHGDVEIPAPYRVTLGKLDGAWRDTTSLLARHRTPIVRRSALINRLNALVRWGLADRRRRSRTMQWRCV